MFLRMSASAPPRNKHAVRQIDRRLAGALEREDVQQEGEVAVLRRAGCRTRSGRYSSLAGLKPLLHALNENGGLATTKSKVLRRPFCVLEVRAGESVVLPDFRRGAVVQDHVHLRQGRRGVIHFLAVER